MEKVSSLAARIGDKMEKRTFDSTSNESVYQNSADGEDSQAYVEWLEVDDFEDPLDPESVHPCDASFLHEDEYRLVPTAQVDEIDQPRDFGIRTLVQPLRTFMEATDSTIEFVFGEWCPFPGLGIVSGSTGIGKSWFVMALAHSLATGQPFLGWMPPRQYNVLLVDGEMHRETLRGRLRSIIAQDRQDARLGILALAGRLNHEDMPYDLSDQQIQQQYIEI